MRLLLDHCVPQRLRHALVGHEVLTAAEMLWERLRNGVLLTTAAAGGFEALITVDQNLKYQQNTAALPIAVVVICSKSNDVDALNELVPLVLGALESLAPRQLIEVRA